MTSSGPTRSSRRFFLDSGLLAASRVTALGGGFLLIVYLARRLGPADFGCFSAVLAYTTWLQLFATAPVFTALVTALARRRPDEPDPLPVGLAITGAVALLLAGGMLAGAGMLGAVIGHSDAALAVRLGAAEVLAGSLASIATAALNGHGRHRTAAGVFLLHPLARLVGCVVLVEVGFGAVGAVAGTALASGVQATGALFMLRHELRWTWPAGFLRIVREAAPVTGLSAALRMMQSIDLLGVVLVRASADIGVYGSAHRLAAAASFVNNSTNIIALQELSAAHARHDAAKARNIATRQIELGLLTLGATLALTPAAPDLALLVLGPQYSGHGTLFMCFVAATGTRLFLSNTIVLVRAARDTNHSTAAVAAGLSALTLFLLLGGAQGRLAHIAAATALVAGGVAWFTTHRALRLWNAPWPWRTIGGTVLGLGAVGLFGVASTGTNVWLRAALCEGLFTAVVLGIGRPQALAPLLKRLRR